jgi:hypothetical protein
MAVRVAALVTPKANIPLFLISVQVLSLIKAEVGQKP